MSSKRKNSRPTKIADIYEAPELLDSLEGNELCDSYSTTDAYMQIQKFLDHDSDGEYAKPGYDNIIIPVNLQFNEISKDEEMTTTQEELAYMKKSKKGMIKVNKSKKVNREKLKTIPKPLKYVCSICNYKTNRSDHHKRHSMTHLKNKPIKCFVCKYNTGRSDHYKRHLLRHGFSRQAIAECCERNGVKLKQTNCSQELLAKENFITKKIPIHPVERKKFICHMCGYSTDKNSHYSRHLHTHSGDQPYKCSDCQKTFKLESYLKKHRCSRKKGNVCPACRSIFINSKALEDHCRRHVDVNLLAGETPKPISTHAISCRDNEKKIDSSNTVIFDAISHKSKSREIDEHTSGKLCDSENSNSKPIGGSSKAKIIVSIVS